MVTTIRTRKLLAIEPAQVIGLGIVPALVAANGLAEALLLASGIITVQLGAFAGMLALRRLVLPGYALFFVAAIAGGFTALWKMIAFALFPDLVRALSLYVYFIPVMLPVLLVARSTVPSSGRPEPFVRTLTLGLIACAALCLIAAMRETIGMGSIFGHELFEQPLVPWARTTTGALMFAALVMAIGALVQKRASPEKAAEANNDR
jgi:Na+-transporting NADH:ubiquinone oxidoreductase subunit D